MTKKLPFDDLLGQVEKMREQSQQRGVNELPKPVSSVRKPPLNDAQPDLLVPRIYDVGTRDCRSIMDVAVYRLSKKYKRANDAIHYELPDGHVTVSSGAAGMASVWDYDIVLMAVSYLTEAMDLYRAGRGPMPSRVFRPHVADVLKFCKRPDGGKGRDDLVDICLRLNTTHIAMRRTAQTKNGKTITISEGEPLISRYKIIENAKKKPEFIEIEIANWMFQEVTGGKTPDVLSVSPDYFLIEPGIGRFIYRLARRAAGKTSAKWSFKTIYEHSGSLGTFKEFCRGLREIIAADDLPDYLFVEEQGLSGPLLCISRRECSG